MLEGVASRGLGLFPGDQVTLFVAVVLSSHREHDLVNPEPLFPGNTGLGS